MHDLTYRIAPAIITLLALTACQDDPLAVTDEQQVPEGDVWETVAAQQARHGNDGKVIDNFRNRLAVHLSVNGGLVPFGTATLTIEGVANEDLVGGAVRVMLPTMAAMEHAGPDQRPSYPVGKGFPAVASWTLPAMDAGETWSQNVAFTLPGQGYYHVAVAVSTTAPADEESPFVFDEGDHEIWLLVLDGGGLVTDFFDGSVVPLGMAPQPGLFRTIPIGRTAGHGDAASRAYSSNDDIEIDLIYYYEGRPRNAVGAQITFKYKMKGSNSTVKTLERTVPSSGIVSVPCPIGSQYIDATARVPHTAQVYADFDIASFYTGTDDCGETTQISSRHTIYMPWFNLDKAARTIESHFSRYRGRIRWEFDPDEDGARYERSDKIVFGPETYHSLWAASHEFGHALHHKELGGLWSNDNCNPHYIDKPSSYTCAFSEGFADYAANVGNGKPSDWESKHWSKWPHDDAEIEGNIAALLLDLIDSSNESQDRTTYPAKYVATVFETCRADGNKRDDVTDFVWCLENRVNEAVHNQGFPGGNDAPDAVTESATEPSDWDADDVRAVWWKNVT